MELFLNIIFHYPVSIFSVLLIVAVIYWLIGCLGLVSLDTGVDVGTDLDLDIPDAGLDLDHGVDLDHAADVDSSGMDGTLAGLLLKLGLNGVPLPVVVTLISLLGWIISYVGVKLCFNFFGLGLLRWLIGTIIFVVAFVASIYLTALIIRPVRKMIMKTRAEVVTSRSLVGRTATVRSPVGPGMDQAACFDGGSEHILLVKGHYEGKSYSRGTTVVLLEYFPDTNTYSIVSEDEFKGLGL